MRTPAGVTVSKTTPRPAYARYLVARTITAYDGDPWRRDVQLVDEVAYVHSRMNKWPDNMRSIVIQWYKLRYAFHLLRECRNYEAIAVGRYGSWFAVLQELFGLHKRIVLMDQEWYSQAGGQLARRAYLSSAAICCNTRIEIERYSQQSGVSRDRFHFVPLAFQARDCRKPSDEGFVFAGGFQGRDWRTLVKAVQGLPYQIRIFTKDVIDSIPSNVTVRTVSREEYFCQMAASSCVVVPVKPELGRITGTTTWTAAMSMGKPVIVTEPLGAPDYMEFGVSGFYVDYGGAAELGRIIDLVMKDPGLRRRVGEAARERAWREFSPEAFRSHVLSLLEGPSPH